MIAYVFQKVIFMSLSGGIVGGSLLFISLLTKRHFSAKWHYYIWLIPLILMLIPFSWQFKTTTDVVPTQMLETAATVNDTQNHALEIMPNDRNDQLVTPQQDVTPKFDYNIIKSFVPIVWFVGFLIMLFYTVIVRALFAIRIRKMGKEPTENDAAVFENVKYELCIHNHVQLQCFTGSISPFVFGIMKPTVFIPDLAMSDDELKAILFHELSHVKRRDLIYKAFANIIAAIHFFNPIIYLIQGQLAKYCELSCDERVVKKMNIDERKMYGRIILSLMSSKSLKLSSSAALVDNIKNTKNRLEIIMNNNNRNKAIIMISVIAVCVIAVSSIVFAINVNNLNKTELSKISTQQDSNADELTPYNTKLNDFISSQPKDFPPVIAYADEEKAVFHNGAGAYVYSIKEHKLLRFIDYRSIHLDTDPQNNFTQLDVNCDGSKALIHNQSIKVEDGKLIRTDTPVWYLYDINTGAIGETDLKKFESPFKNLMYHAFDGKSNIFTGSDYVGIYTTDTVGTVGAYGARIDDNTIIYARYPYLCKPDEEDKLRIENTEVVIYNIKAGTFEKYKLFEKYTSSETINTDVSESFKTNTASNIPKAAIELKKV